MRDLGHVLMKEFTTMQTGGTSRVIVVEHRDDLQELLRWYHRKLFILGAGSNIIARDQGIPGVVLKNEMRGMYVHGERIIAESGVMLPDVSEYARLEGLTGLEFAEGIPGTVGGGVYMNAGFTADMASVVESVTVADYSKGSAVYRTYQKEECGFAFRKSAFQERRQFIVDVTFKLQRGDREQIKQRMDRNRQLRKKRQPLDYPSAGSVFKPNKKLKEFYEFRINQVKYVSPGFVINLGGGNSYDIIIMIRKIQKETGAELEVEIV